VRARPYVVVRGVAVPDFSTLDFARTRARKLEVEERLRAIRGDLSLAGERRALVAEALALDVRMRDFRGSTARENQRRNRSGIGSPLHKVLCERYPALVAELEAAALEALAERERREAERKASNRAPSDERAETDGME
jgi:hypothetical protein